MQSYQGLSPSTVRQTDRQTDGLMDRQKSGQTKMDKQRVNTFQGSHGKKSNKDADIVDEAMLFLEIMSIARSKSKDSRRENLKISDLYLEDGVT